MRWVITVLASVLAGCSNAPIDAGGVYGPFTQVKTFFTSAFLAVDGESAVLVDAGFNPKARQVSDALEERGLTLDAVTDVLITHGHGDHLRGLEALPNARVWAHEAEVALIAEEGPEGSTVTNPIVDGELITIGALTFEVLHVPGHTEGNVVFLSEGVLLTGDTAISYKDGTVGPAPERYSDDPLQATSELTALVDRLSPRAAEIDAVVFGHSQAITDLGPFWALGTGGTQ